MKTRFLSRFTPSLMSQDALEAIFVQRESLCREVLDRIRRSVLTRTSLHTLLIGPRGIGKTHFISLTYYRVSAMDDIRERLLIAWLREEEWGITCYRDFLFSILRALPSQIPDGAALERRVESLHALTPDQAESAAARALKELVGGRILLLLVENLDDLFRRLGSEGQSRLRAFMTDNPFFSIVATCPASFSDLVRPGAPFGGLFLAHQLQELSFEDATQLVAKIARYEGNDKVSAFVATPRGRARMRALRYLAGGNHRAYVIFSQLLAHDRLEDLMEPLMRTVDDLTPYYHARISTLTPEQRKIIEYVCETRHPVRAGDVARACFVTPGSAAMQMEELKQIGHVQSLKIGSETYYELREPLMRLSIEVKKHRGKPIRLLLDFLRLWYSPTELRHRISTLPGEAGLEREYAVPAVQLAEQDWEDPRVPECCRAYNESLRKHDHEQALQAAEDLVSIRGSLQDMSAQASCLFSLGRDDEAVAIYDRIVAQWPADAGAWQLRGWALSRMGRFEEALASCDRSIALDENTGRAWCCRGSTLLGLGRLDEAVSSCTRAIQLDARDAQAWSTRGNALAALDCYDEAAEAFSQMIKLEPGNATAHAHLSAALIELKRYDEGLAEAERTSELNPRDRVAHVLQGYALSGQNRHADALACFEKAIEMGEQSSLVHFKCAQLLMALDHWREGSASLDAALVRFAHSDERDAGSTAGFIRNLFAGLRDPDRLRLRIKVLVLLYRKHKVLSPLGQGLIECIPDLISGDLFTEASARLWLDSWKAVARDLPEFRLPLRFLDFAVRYRESQDSRLFMELPQEERTMLESVVGMRLQESALPA